MVPAHGLDRSNALQFRDGRGAGDVPAVKDEVDPTQELEEAIRQPVDKFGAVGVGDHADARGQAGRMTDRARGVGLLDTGGLQACSVCAPGVSAGIQRVHRARGESVCVRLVEVQIDVGERKPGAIGLPA